MTRTDKRFEFVAVLAQEIPHLKPVMIADLAQALMREGAKQSRLACALCNDAIAPQKLDVRIRRVREKLFRLVDAFGIKVVCGGDPRGATVKLIFPSGRSNCFAGEGWSVPGS
jgi:hypothetical protein